MIELDYFATKTKQELRQNQSKRTENFMDFNLNIIQPRSLTIKVTL